MIDVPLMHALLKAVPDSRRAVDRRRYRSAALGRAGPGARRLDRFGRCSRGQTHRSVPAGGAKPNRHQAHRINKGDLPDFSEAGRRQRLSTSSKRSQPEQPYHGHSELVTRAHPQALRPRSHPRHPGAVPHEPERPWGALAQYRTAEGAEPAGERKDREIRHNIRAQRQGDADRERLRQGGL